MNPKVWYTPNIAFGISRKSALKKEFKTVGDIKLGMRGNTEKLEHLALEWELLESERVVSNGVTHHYTIRAAKAECDYEKHIKEVSSADFSQAKGDIRQIMQGVTALHSEGWIHGDLKPENCLVYKKGDKLVVKIADFGKAVKVEDNKFLPLKGNTRFAAPEKLASKKGEVYSVALMMIRSLEETLPKGTVIKEVNKENRDCKVHESRRGVEKFILEHKAFPTCENKGTWSGKIRNIILRIPFRKASSENMKTQESLLKDYTHNLCEKLKTNGSLPKSSELEKLLNDMLSQDPDKRPSMEDALNRYNGIFPEGS